MKASGEDVSEVSSGRNMHAHLEYVSLGLVKERPSFSNPLVFVAVWARDMLSCLRGIISPQRKKTYGISAIKGQA